MIKRIAVPFVFNVTVNCYLVQTGNDYFLIDTGLSSQRALVEAELESAGCRPGSLKLIILTHGDPDHAGNAAYFRQKYGARIAIHPADSGMVEQGTMTWNRKVTGFGRIILQIMSRIFAFETFTPDMVVEDGFDFFRYGLNAHVVELPGHSKGNVGILTDDGDLFCGDLLANTDKPGLWSMMDDIEAAHASVEKLKGFTIDTVYPGHGRPFLIEQILEPVITG